MAKAWVYQDDKQVKKHGEDKASWYVGWITPAGKRRCKSCGSGKEGERAAEKYREKVQSQLNAGTYEDHSKATWDDFREQYDKLVLDGMAPATRQETASALAHFERLLKPKKIGAVCSSDFLVYVSKRRKEEGAKPGTTVAVATINKEMRHLRAVCHKAKKLGFLTQAPEIEFLKEPKKLPCWLPPDHFASIYHACDVATMPTNLPYPASQWWQSLLVVTYLTGWRIGSILSLGREDVDLDAGLAISQAEDNKGGRDQAVSLHPLAIEHLRKVPSFHPVFFPWPHGDRQLYDTFGAIQIAAGVKPARGKRRYGFHDLRRAFATLNAGRLSADVLQALMQHKDYKTTQRYIDLARQLKPAAHDIFVPDLGKKGNGGTVEGHG